MANPIAEAFVAIRPDLTNFGPQLQAGVTNAMRGVTIPGNAQTRLGQQLFGTGFRQAATTSTTTSRWWSFSWAKGCFFAEENGRFVAYGP